MSESALSRKPKESFHNRAPYLDDEIILWELIEDVWQRKKPISIFVLCSTILTVALLYSLPTTYQASIEIEKSSKVRTDLLSSDLELEFAKTDRFVTTSYFNVIYSILQDGLLWQEYCEKNQCEGIGVPSVTVLAPNVKKVALLQEPTKLEITLTAKSDAMLLPIIKEYLQLVAQHARRKVSADFTQQLQEEQAIIRQKIDFQRDVAKKQRLAQISRLKKEQQLAQKEVAEQLRVLADIGSYDTIWRQKIEQLKMQQQFLLVNPLLEDLQKRDNDDPYIEDLPQLQAQLQQIDKVSQMEREEELSFNYGKTIARHPIKSKRVLIIVAVALLSLFTAIFFACVHAAWCRRPKSLYK